MPDFLEVAEEHGRVLDIAMRAVSGVTRHAALAVQVLALKRSLDLAPHDVNVVTVVRIVTVGTGAPTEACGLGADFGAHALVEEGVAGRGDFGREGGVGELGGELGGDLCGAAG